MLRQVRDRRRRRLLPVAGLTALGVLLGGWHNRQAAAGRPDPFVSAVRTVTAPLVGAAAGAGRWVGSRFGWITRGWRLDQENRLLREENARLRDEVARLREADASAKRLRALLGLEPSEPSRRIAADVISRLPSPHLNTLVISRGIRDGVRLQAPVVAGGGLVGQVFDAGPTTAAVLLLTDASSAVGGLVQRADSRAVGVCRGNGGPLLTLAYLRENARVVPGDVVVSSGLGGRHGVFPKGLVIGVVERVTPDASGASPHVLVRPAVDFSRLEEVFVLR